MLQAGHIPLFTFCALCVAGLATASNIDLTTSLGDQRSTVWPDSVAPPSEMSPLGESLAAPRSVFDVQEHASQVQSPAIPEPATLLLLGAGLFGVGFGARLYGDRASTRNKTLHRRQQ